MTAEVPIMSRGLGQFKGQAAKRDEDYTISRHMPRLFTPYPSNTPVDEDGILPYMARLHSPIRVTFSPTRGMKRKSRISNQTQTATFNFRPVKSGDKLNMGRFKPPDSTLPSLQYLSPWISVTKGDYRDPRQPQEGRESVFVNSRSSMSLQRSVSDLQNISRMSDFRSSSKATTVTDSQTQSRVLDSQSLSRVDSCVTRDVSAKTQSSDKRVTFTETLEQRLADELENRNSVTPAKAERTSNDLQTFRLPDKMDFYSGYFPTEVSEKILVHLNNKQQPSEKSVGDEKEFSILEKGGQYYKPLIGDRSLFMRESYPTKPVIYRSDIEQLRFEGHERLMKSTGQAPAQFSTFKDRGTLIRPKGKGMHLEEALKKQQRLSKSANNAGIRRHKTAIEIFEGQRDKTYELQRRAKEIINKA